MTINSPQMKSMFGGKPKGGFFDLPLLAPGDIADADIILPLPTKANIMGLIA